MLRRLRYPGPSTARPGCARPLSGGSFSRCARWLPRRVALRLRARLGGVCSRGARGLEFRELLAQLLYLAVERIDLTACRQPESAHQSLGLLPLLIEQRGRSVGELSLQAAEVFPVHGCRVGFLGTLHPELVKF